jgi:cardiolipin synthase A/B
MTHVSGRIDCSHKLNRSFLFIFGKMESPLFQSGNYKSADAVQLLESGTEFFSALLMLINNAKTSLHLQYYALVPDETGNEIIQALKEAAQRGVSVKLLLDAFGSKAMKGNPLNELEKAGVECRMFSPFILYKLRTGRRLHHKIIVADSVTAIAGGINVSDKYKGVGGEMAWLDFALQIQGTVCTDIVTLCERLFYVHKYSRKRKHMPANSSSGLVPVRIAHEDWFLKKHQVHKDLEQAIYFAKERIVIVCSYFIPNYKMIRLLKQAAARGVAIQVYLQGKSDILLARDAGRYWYRALQRQHITIYEFPARVLHGKLAMIDDKWLTLGSSNFNHLSNYTSIETNTEIFSEKFCTIVKSRLQKNFDEYAVKIAPQMYLSEKNPFRLFRWWLSWQLSNLLMLFLFNLTSKNS